MEIAIEIANSLSNKIMRFTIKLVKRILKPFSGMIDWANSYSLWPVHFTTSCCGSEFAATYDPRFDSERFGSLPFTHVRNTNTIIIEGTISKKMAKALKVVYDQMPSPKYVIAMGACAIDGGIFYNSYNVVKPRDFLPVEVYIPGCPPRPEAVENAILTMQRRIRELRIASKKVTE